MLESSLWSLLSLVTTSSPSGSPGGSIFLTLFLQIPSPVLASPLPPAWARPLWRMPEFLQPPSPAPWSPYFHPCPTEAGLNQQQSEPVKTEVLNFCLRHKHRIMSFCIRSSAATSHFTYWKSQRPGSDPQALGDLALSPLDLLLLVHSQCPPSSGPLPWAPCLEYSFQFSVTCVTTFTLLSEALSTHFLKWKWKWSHSVLSNSLRCHGL